MSRPKRLRLAGLGALLLALWSSPAMARSYSVDDLLATEDIGRTVFDPTGRWLVIEHRRAWKTAGRFDTSYFTPLLATELLTVDLTNPGMATPLFIPSRIAGYMAGPIAPDGRKILVYRFTGRAYEIGVAVLATGEVRWLGLTPEQPIHGPTAAWRSASEVVLIVRPEGDMTWQLGIGWEAQQRLAALTARTAAGLVPAATAVGSGRFIDVRPKGETPRLMALNLDTGGSRLLARGEFVDLALSPDGRYAAAIENNEDLQPQAGEPVYAAYPTRRRSLAIVDLDTGVATTPSVEVSLGLLAWSPAGDRLLAAGLGPERRRPDPVVIEAASGTVDRPLPAGLAPALTTTSEGAPLLRADWMGANPIVYATEGGRADWYRLGDGAPRNLTADFLAAPQRLAALDATHLVLESEGQAWRVAADGTRRPLGRTSGLAIPAQDPGGRFSANPVLANWSARVDGRRVAIAPAQGPGRIFPLPKAAKVLAAGPAGLVTETSGPGGVRSVSVSRPGGAPRPVLTLNRAMADVTPAAAHPVAHAGPAGEALTSWLYLPATPPPPGGYPVVVIPYRGRSYPTPAPDFAVGGLSLQVNPQILAAAGYAVLTPSLPFDVARGEPLEGAAAQILQVVDRAAADYPLDTGRIALWGHSFGALTAVAAAAQSPRFRSVIAASGAHDEISYWGSFRLHQWVVPEDGVSSTNTAGVVEAGQAHMMAPPWADPARYVRNSNLFQADKIEAPVLLIHGQADELNADQSQQMFSGLYRQGKDAVFVTYWGEGHVLASPANIADLYARVLAWLGDTLAPARRDTQDRTQASTTAALSRAR